MAPDPAHLTADALHAATTVSIAADARTLADALATPPVPAPGMVIHPALAAGLAAAADALRGVADRLDARTAPDVPGAGDD